MANALGMKEAKGVLVQSTVKGGAGEAAGLKEGDVILSVDGKEVNAGNELQSYIATHHPGDRVMLKIFRDGSVVEKPITLKARDEEKTVVAASEPRKEEEENSVESPRVMKFDNLGLSVRSMTPDERKELEVDRGVIVTDVKPYGEAFNRAIGKNMVIVEADRKQVNSPSELKKVVDGRKPGDSLLLRIRSERGTSFVAVQIPK
jgi:serine protease Do